MSQRKSGGGRLGAKPRGRRTDTAKPAFDFSDQPRLSAPRAREDDALSARPGQRLGELVIDRLSDDGRGIAQWQGKTLFVEGALPGETVSARFAREHSRYAEAVVDQVITASAERQLPPCAHYVHCGGCQLQHLDPAAQLRYKQQVVLQQLQRWANLSPRQLLPAVTSGSEAYRQRARLGVWYEADGQVVLGFRQRQSNRLTPVDTCLVLPPSLNALLVPLHGWLLAHSARAVTHVELLNSLDGCAMVLRHTKNPGERDRQGLRALARSTGARIWLDNGKEALQDLDGCAVDPRLHYRFEDLQLNYHPQDFIQVNAGVNDQMLAQALVLLDPRPGERILDLFCGIGNFTLPMARRGARVMGIEAVESMVARGRENAAANHLPQAEFMAADLTRLDSRQLLQRCGAVDALLLDPPREGARGILAGLAPLGIGRILYVSCNPATFARDARLLADAGYRLDTLGVIDMFPHTAHVETMGLFLRR